MFGKYHRYFQKTGVHMQKSIVIIGAGMGGIASGIFGQLNDYRTNI